MLFLVLCQLGFVLLQHTGTGMAVFVAIASTSIAYRQNKRLPLLLLCLYVVIQYQVLRTGDRGQNLSALCHDRVSDTGARSEFVYMNVPGR